MFISDVSCLFLIMFISDLSCLFLIYHVSGFQHALEIMENLENQEKKFHAGKNHGIWKSLNNHGKIMEFCEIIWQNHRSQKTCCQTRKTCVSDS